MGSYDFKATRAINISLIRVTQTNDIMDHAYWGIMGSNFCKNLLYDGCVLSRFDAHQGVANATIRNSTIGYVGIKLIGFGTALIENTTVQSDSLISLRGDYGSTWNGDIIVRNSTFIPTRRSVNIIKGSNDGQHDFGYTCYMAQKVVIDNLTIEDKDRANNYPGPAVFSDPNPRMKDTSYEQEYPYVLPREVLLRNITTASGKPLRISDNAFMFQDVNVIRED